MPGMMDTVLNIGLNDDVAEHMVERTGDARGCFMQSVTGRVVTRPAD